MGKKQIRAANRTAKPHEIRLPRTRISNHKPRKGTETGVEGRTNADPARLISNHKPRKGTETRQLRWLYIDIYVISNHKPRKGTETIKARQIGKPYLISNHKPRKGTETQTACPTPMLPPHFKPQTPQGDGNWTRVISLRSNSLSISNHKPRKGTETLLHPAHNEPSFLPISNHKPRKGTETFTSRPVCRGLVTHFKPQTPQGDGNQIRTCRNLW